MPGCRVEVLIPDFQGDPHALATVLDAGPDVLNHNIETVPRIYKAIRPGSDYQHSLTLLKRFKEECPDVTTKCGLMVGIGETKEEVLAVLDDLRAHNVDLVTIGQYLQPTRKHHAVIDYIHPDQFKAYETIAYTKGFLLVSATPLTRSSHHAGEDFARLKAAREKQLGR